MDIEVTKAQGEKFIQTAEVLRSIESGEGITSVLHLEASVTASARSSNKLFAYLLPVGNRQIHSNK